MSGCGKGKAPAKSKSGSVQKPKPAAKQATLDGFFKKPSPPAAPALAASPPAASAPPEPPAPAPPAAAPPAEAPAKKPAARAAPAPAAAAPPAPTKPTLQFNVVTTAQRKAPRTLATWVEQKDNAAFFVKYMCTVKNEETREQVPVWLSAFSVKDTSLTGGLRTIEDAVHFAKRAWLSRAADDSDVWNDPDAAALCEPSRDLISNPEERQNNGYQRFFRPGARVLTTASGHCYVESTQQQAGVRTYARRFIDDAALDSLQDRLRGEDDFLVDCVLNYAADVESMSPDEQRELLFDRAWALRRENEAAALLRRENYQRHVDENMEVLVAEFDDDIGLTQAVKDDLKRTYGKEVNSFRDLDDCPLACLLGDEDNCPIYPKIMKCFYRSQRRNATRGVQGRVPLLCNIRETTICCLL